MLYKLMKFLFHDDDYYRYTPKPWHIVYPVLMIAVGSVTSSYWIAFGISMIVGGIILEVTIVIGIAWDKAIEYWSEIRNVFEAMAKIKDDKTRYELLKSMGYNVTPDSVQVIETRRDDNGIFQGMSIKKYPVHPSTMQRIADKVLGEYITNGTMEFNFAEDKFSFVKNIRKTKKQFMDDGYISQKNKKNVRLGYRWTKKGVEALREYASEGIRLELMRKEKGDG